MPYTMRVLLVRELLANDLEVQLYCSSTDKLYETVLIQFVKS